jgi:peroxiredoxin
MPRVRYAAAKLCRSMHSSKTKARTLFRYLCISCLLALNPLTVVGLSSERDFTTVIEQFSLSSNYGKEIALREFSDKPILVLAFIGTECPLARLYGPRLNDLQEEFKDKGVAILGISSNKQDSLTELTAYVHRHKIDFPVLKDVGNRLADAVGATRTPEIYVLDAQRHVRYHGRIDDQYGIGVARGEPTREDLREAIDALIASKEVAVPETNAVGCYIGRVKEASSKPTTAITFNRDIAPILNARCVSCHRNGEIGPFTLTSYEDVLGWEDTILEVIAENRMPPWNANPDFGHFKNDARLNATERQLISDWIAGGMPQGDDKDLPPPPKFTEGWRIPEPDQVFAMRDTSFTIPAQGVVDYKRFVVDPGWTEDKYITAAEARPENREVVHHILVYIIPPGERRADLRQVLVGYAPGSLPVLCDDGVAMKIEAGSKLLFEMHYTPNGTEQTDCSYAGVCFTEKDQVKKLLNGGIAIETEFLIPAGAPNHKVMAQYRSSNDEQLISMTPHMHLRGKAFRYVAHYPDGGEEILLDVPNYDFNWQLKYILEKPKLLVKGTRVVCTAQYDNSDENLANPDPTRDVRWGDQSWEEMMIGFLDTIPIAEEAL